jgi:hypothetical protein
MCIAGSAPAGASSVSTIASAASESSKSMNAQHVDFPQRKLPEVEALIARAEAMREWLLKPQQCRCSSLELCALFARKEAA